MKILLLGEYSNMHWSIAEGLRELGQDVTVASDGDTFKDCQRDITIKREGYAIYPTVKYVYSIAKNFRQFRGFDVVQIISPCFLDLKADRNLWLFKYLKKHNSKIFLGAFGADYYWTKACYEKKIFRYSEFDIPHRSELLGDAQKLLSFWTRPQEEYSNKYMAEHANAIIACLYEYYESYKQDYAQKLAFIPEPIDVTRNQFVQRGLDSDSVHFFIGIQTKRTRLKGTDVMYAALQDIHSKYPNETTLKMIESMPHRAYLSMKKKSDVLLDQLYSYTPSMNALESMAQGLVVLSGGEPEMYDLMGEFDNRPIVNVYPNYEGVYAVLEELVLNKQTIPKTSLDSRLFVEKYHSHLVVSQQYLDFWNSN